MLKQQRLHENDKLESVCVMPDVEPLLKGVYHLYAGIELAIAEILGYYDIAVVFLCRCADSRSKRCPVIYPIRLCKPFSKLEEQLNAD